MGDVWESSALIEEVWESGSTPGVEWTVVIREGDIVTGGSGVDLSDATPAALGTAAPGVGTEASRSDHVHGLPSAADVGAAAVSHQHSASDVTSGVLDDARIPSSVARDSEVSQAVSDHDGSLTAHPDIRAAIPDPQFMRVTAIVSDETDAIVFGDPAPDDADAVLVFGRSSGDGVYSMSTVDGWELLDPQPTLVASDDLLDWVSGEPFWTGGATWFNYTAGGWQLVGSTPNLAEGNASSVWTPTGWRSGFPDPTGATAGHVWTADGLDAAEWAAPSAAGGADLSDTAPQDLGTAAAGTSEDASRADHVHDMPTAADIAVDASGFNGNLTTSDDTVQEIAQKLDDLAAGGSETLAATIIDAKGDLIAGTAADTAARLAVGTTNGQVLAVSSGATPGVAWTAPGPPMLIPSTRYSLGGPWASDTATATAQDAGYMIGTLMYLPPGQSFDRIGILISASGASGATLRLGIYNIGANGYPTTQVVAHTGTLNCGSGGLKEATVSFVGVGWCWGVWQTAGAAVVSRAPAPSPMIAPLYVAESHTTNRLIYVARADSALPSDLTAQSWTLSNAYPHGIQVRAA